MKNILNFVMKLSNLYLKDCIIIYITSNLIGSQFLDRLREIIHAANKIVCEALIFTPVLTGSVSHSEVTRFERAAFG